MKALGVLGAFAVLVVFYPLGLIWALNLLFGLHIPYQASTWLAMVLVSGLFSFKLSKGN